MKPYIIFFDIDGTIFNEKTKEISPITKAAIARARENGHYTFVNTGRSLAEVGKEVLEVGFDGIVCGCGTYIQYRGETLFQKSLGNKLSLEIAEDLKKNQIDAILEGTHAIYIDEEADNADLLKLEKYFGKRIMEKMKYWSEQDMNFDKFSMWLTKKSHYRAFEEKYKAFFEFIDRGNDFFEVIPLGYSKASGIQYLMEYLHIPQEHTIAIGDSTNDLSMLEYAHISIGMGNSAKAVLEKVSYVTKTVAEEGVAYGLEHFGII